MIFWDEHFLWGRFRRVSLVELGGVFGARKQTAERSQDRPRGLRRRAAFRATGSPVGRELIAIGLGVGEHYLTREGDDFGRIIVFAQRVEIVQVTHERRVRLIQTGELGSGAAR